MTNETSTQRPSHAVSRRIALSAFLAVAATESAVAMPSSPDAELIAAGEAFEPLFAEYFECRLRWGVLHRQGKAETIAKFGDDKSSDAWQKPSFGECPAALFRSDALERNGCNDASDASSAIGDQMEPLAAFIRETAAKTVEGLRAKTMVAIWDCLPIGACHDGGLRFDDPDSHFSLFHAAISVAGLSKMLAGVEARLQTDAALQSEDGG